MKVHKKVIKSSINDTFGLINLHVTYESAVFYQRGVEFKVDRN